jgi:hypothetical protein
MLATKSSSDNSVIEARGALAAQHTTASASSSRSRSRAIVPLSARSTDGVPLRDAAITSCLPRSAATTALPIVPVPPMTSTLTHRDHRRPPRDQDRGGRAPQPTRAWEPHGRRLAPADRAALVLPHALRDPGPRRWWDGQVPAARPRRRLRLLPGVRRGGAGLVVLRVLARPADLGPRVADDRRGVGAGATRPSVLVGQGMVAAAVR